MKQLLSLDQDYIIVQRFIANRMEPNEKGYPAPEWTDETKTLQNGKKVVDFVECLAMEADQYGNFSNICRKIYLSKSDILKLSKSIEEIESEKATGIEGEEMPF